MKHRLFHFVLLLALMLSGDPACGQGSPGVKKPRTPDDYKARTLKEIAAAGVDEKSRRDKEDTRAIHPDILPSRVRVIYTGSRRPLPQIKKDVIAQWARLYAGSPEHYTKPYETEMLFTEQGVAHWLAVQEKSLPDFEKELKKGRKVDLYLIRLGSSRTTGRKWEPVLLVESFKAGVK